MKCNCGAEHTGDYPGESMGARRQRSGWSYVWNVSSGLAPIWLCPECAAKVRALLAQVVAFFPGLRLGHLNFLPLEKS